MAEPARRWRVKDARAGFSELVDRALSEGPQVVTRRGRPAVVVVSAESGARNRRRGNLVDFFAASPSARGSWRIPRLADRPRRSSSDAATCWTPNVVSELVRPAPDRTWPRGSGRRTRTSST